MKYEESYPGLKADIVGLIKSAVPDTFSKTLEEAGVRLALPEDRELELKCKYDLQEDGGSLTLKISWNDGEEEEEEEDEEEDKEDD